MTIIIDNIVVHCTRGINDHLVRVCSSFHSRLQQPRSTSWRIAYRLAAFARLAGGFGPLTSRRAGRGLFALDESAGVLAQCGARSVVEIEHVAAAIDS